MSAQFAAAMIEEAQKTDEIAAKLWPSRAVVARITYSLSASPRPARTRCWGSPPLRVGIMLMTSNSRSLSALKQNGVRLSRYRLEASQITDDCSGSAARSVERKRRQRRLALIF